MINSLAIVIPAFKIKYFNEALSSIAAQTNKNFKVYVCDDGSKEDIKSVVDVYADQINVQYNQFHDNLGATNLTQHWDRSVNLANEDWIWLFSDDDILSSNCVQAFLDAVNTTGAKHNVYRFNIEMIDGDSRVICIKEPHPITETGYDFVKRRLQGTSLSAAVEYVFRKDVFKRAGGFVSFPLAFCSDDASWATFAGDLDIYTIKHATVYWRSSNINISSAKGLHKQKIEALVQYSEWVKARYSELPLEDIERWFFENLRYVYGKPGILERYRLAVKLSSVFNKSKTAYWTKLMSDGVF